MPDDFAPTIVTLEPTTVAAMRETVAMDALPEFYDRAFGHVVTTLQAQGVAVIGPAVGVYFGMPGATADLAAGFPTDRPAAPRDGVSALALPTGRAAQVTHVGGYDLLPQTYERLLAWLDENGHPRGTVFWETYLTEPTPDADPADMRTQITWTLAG